MTRRERKKEDKDWVTIELPFWLAVASATASILTAIVLGATVFS